MRKTLLVLFSLFCSVHAFAIYTIVPVTGFSDDVVANGVTSALLSTTNTADGGTLTFQYDFMDATFNGGAGLPTVFLPTGGLFTTATTTTPNLQYQLASYSANNDLRLGSNATGTLTFTTPISASEVFVAAFCGNGTIPMTMTVNFTDGTTQVMSQVTVQDWFTTTASDALIGVGRVNRTSNVPDNNTTNPRLHQLPNTILAANYNKLIQSLTFATGTGSNSLTSTLGIMAVTVNTPSKVTVTPSVTSICSGTPVTFTAVVTGMGGTLTYQWKKNGTNVGTNTNTYTDATLTATDQITVTVTTSLTTAVPSTLTSTAITTVVNATPIAPAAITGPNPICINSTNTFSTIANTGLTYTWTIPTGWSAPSTTGGSITPTANATSGTISVIASSACGTSAATSLAVTVVTTAVPSVAISTIVPSGAICAGTSVTFTATPTNGGATPSYQWKKNGSNTGTNSTTYTDAALVNGDVITVVMTSSLGCASPATGTSAGVTMTVNTAPAQPGTITGNTTVCSGTTQAYSIASVATATTYTWTAPTGWTGTSTTPAVSYVVNTTSGNVTVIATNACGNSAQKVLAVTSISTPVTPGAITGNTVPCALSSQTYSVAAVPAAASYNWTIPSGWSGVSTTNSITATTTAASGNVTVTATNACGTSSAATLPVTSFNGSAAPGVISGSTTPCSNTSQTYSVAAVAGATSYNWILPGGWSGFSSANSITLTTGTGGGQLQVSANNSCGVSPAASLAVAPVLSVTPVVIISTPSNNICQTTSATFTALTAGGGTAPVYQWKKNGLNVGTNSPVYTDNFLANGNVITVTMTSNAPCATSTNVTSAPITMVVIPTTIPGININVTPPTINCAGVPLTFATNITGGGASPAYQWYVNGILQNGATSTTYTSSTLNNLDTVTVMLTSSAACLNQNAIMSNKVGVGISANVIPTAVITASPGGAVSPGTAITFTSTITNGGPTPGYQWLKNGVPIGFNGTSATYTSPTSGLGMLRDNDQITLRLTSYAACANPGIVISNMLKMNIPTAVGSLNGWAGSLNIYPNPSTGHFTIAADWGAGHNGDRVKIDMVNALGQAVYTTEVAPTTAHWSIDVSLDASIANGIYQLRIHSNDAGVVKPVMIQR